MSRDISTWGWPEVVGYQHEVLHTGVARAALLDPVAGPQLACDLTDQEVVSVEDVHLERRVDGHQGIADLVAEIKLQSGGAKYLAIETKVDSRATHEQLERTVGSNGFGVLLALGITALQWEQEDLRRSNSHWKVVGPERWAGLLRQAALPAVFDAYIKDVEHEVREHREATATALDPQGPIAPIGHRRPQEELADFAWLREVRRLAADRPSWWTYKNQSGPLMGTWVGVWKAKAPVDVFIEFVCSPHRREFAVKIGGETGLAALVPEIRDTLEGEHWAGARPPRASATTCTVASLDFSGEAPARVLPVVNQTLASLRKFINAGD